MAFAQIASQIATLRDGPITSTTVSFPNDVSAGNLIVLPMGTWENVGAGLTVTVTKSSGSATLVGGSTLTTLFGSTGAGYGSGTMRPGLSYAVVQSSGSLTLQVAANHTMYIAAATDEFSGTSPALDVNGGELSGSSTPFLDTITPLTANALIMGVIVLADNNRTITMGSGYTEIDTEPDNTYQPYSTEFKIATTVTSYNVDWSIDSANAWVILNAAFKETGSAVEPFALFLIS